MDETAIVWRSHQAGRFEAARHWLAVVSVVASHERYFAAVASGEHLRGGQQSVRVAREQRLLRGGRLLSSSRRGCS